MGLKHLLRKIFRITAKKVMEQTNLSREHIALHEAAHGIVWYLFKENWIVNSLSIERNGLPDEDMNGALHISPNFKESQNSIERVNELFAISLAGLIGQNINLIIQRENLIFELMNSSDFSTILDTRGCAGDFEIGKRFLPHLGQEFKVSEGSIMRYKIFDLIRMFQDHSRVQQIHLQLSQLLLQKGTLSRNELFNFFEQQNFQEYIEEENLDINFFHKR